MALSVFDIISQLPTLLELNCITQHSAQKHRCLESYDLMSCLCSWGSPVCSLLLNFNIWLRVSSLEKQVLFLNNNFLKISFTTYGSFVSMQVDMSQCHLSSLLEKWAPPPPPTPDHLCSKSASRGLHKPRLITLYTSLVEDYYYRLSLKWSRLKKDVRFQTVVINLKNGVNPRGKTSSAQIRVKRSK